MDLDRSIKHRRHTRRTAAVVLTGLLAATLSVLGAPGAHAAAGEIVRSFEAQSPPCSVGVGVAFDGFQLLVSCSNTNVLTGVSTSDGAHIRDYPTQGAGGIGARSRSTAPETGSGCANATSPGTRSSSSPATTASGSENAIANEPALPDVVVGQPALLAGRTNKVPITIIGAGETTGVVQVTPQVPDGWGARPLTATVDLATNPTVEMSQPACPCRRDGPQRG